MGLSTTLPGMGPGVWRVTFGGTIRDALFIVRILIAGAPGMRAGDTRQAGTNLLQ